MCLFGLVFECAQGIEDGGGFFGDEAVFDDAAVACESMMPSVRRRARWLAMPVGEEPSACASSVMLRSPSSSRKRDGPCVRGLAISLRMVRETLGFPCFCSFYYMNA